MIANSKKHLVNFRLTDAEFDNLKNACSQNGARSISDYVREAVLRSCAAGPDLDRLSLVQRVIELRTAVQHMTMLLERYQAPSDREGRS